MKKIVEIKNDNGDVIVLDNNKEVYRAEKTKQTITIANSIYFYHKYIDNKETRSLKVKNLI